MDLSCLVFEILPWDDNGRTTDGPTSVYLMRASNNGLQCLLIMRHKHTAWTEEQHDTCLGWFHVTSMMIRRSYHHRFLRRWDRTVPK